LICSSQMRDVFVPAIVHTMYTIWLARNALRYSSDTFSLHSTKATISSMVALSRAVSTSNCLPHCDDVLENFIISPSYRRFKDIIPIIWKPPAVNWIKVTPSVPVCKPPLLFSHFLRKVVTVINVSILCVNIIELYFVCMCIKFDFSYFKTR